MALDLDEMLVVKVGDGRLADLIAAAPPFDLIDGQLAAVRP